MASSLTRRSRRWQPLWPMLRMHQVGYNSLSLGLVRKGLPCSPMVSCCTDCCRLHCHPDLHSVSVKFIVGLHG
jgi:hypothetical protein